MATNDLFSEADEAKRQRLHELRWTWDHGRRVWIDPESRWWTEEKAFEFLDKQEPKP
jgi:hypothetical protein